MLNTVVNALQMSTHLILTVTLELGIILISMLGRGNWGTQSLRNLPKVTQLLSSRTKIWAQLIYIQSSTLVFRINFQVETSCKFFKLGVSLQKYIMYAYLPGNKSEFKCKAHLSEDSALW